MRADGSHARPLPMSRAGFDVEPKYSPDGRWIAFGRLRPDATASDWQAAIFIVARRRRPRPPAHALGRLRRAPHLVAGRPLDHLQHARRDDRGDPTGRPRAAHDPRRHRGLRRPQALVLTRRQADPVRVRRSRFPDGGFNDDLCVMDADGSNIVNLTPNTPRHIRELAELGTRRPAGTPKAEPTTNPALTHRHDWRRRTMQRLVTLTISTTVLVALLAATAAAGGPMPLTRQPSHRH